MSELTEERIRAIAREEIAKLKMEAKLSRPFPKLPPDSAPIVELRGPIRR